MAASQAIGCAAPTNPSFSITAGDAKADIRRMRDDPKGPERPVLVLAGWADPFFVSSYWVSALEKTGVPEADVLGVSFVGRYTLASCREKVLESVQESWPSGDPEWTTEVDVVAYSMGGLVARLSAAPRRDDDQNPRRLRINRLYTISTPHRGSQLSALAPSFLTLDRRIIEMKPGSNSLEYLDEMLGSPETSYALVPYARLGDWVIGTANTSPADTPPYWVPTPFLHRSHIEAYRDPRIVADILRRLRGEEHLTLSPAAPLPE